MSDEEKTQDSYRMIVEALHDVFGTKEDMSTRFVDVSRVPLLCASILRTSKDISDIKKSLDEKYVTKEKFEPIKNLVYGAVGLILVAVVGAILALIIK
jgi:hypothetical protein